MGGVSAMAKWLTKIAAEAKVKAKTEGLPVATPYAFYGFAEDPFHPTLPLRVDEEEQKKFFGHRRMTELLYDFLKRVIAVYEAKAKRYESTYRVSKDYGSGLIPNLVFCGPPSTGRTTIGRLVVSALNAPEILGQQAAVRTGTNEWNNMGSSIAEGMQRWLDPVHRREDGKESLANLKVLFIDDADLILDFLGWIHSQIHDLANGPVVLIPILTPIGYDFLAEYHCEKDQDIDQMFGLSSKLSSRANLTVWARRWSTNELVNMLKNRLYIAGGKLDPFSEPMLEEISKHALGLPGHAIELAENVLRRSERFNMQKSDSSTLEYAINQLGINQAEGIILSALEERQMLLTSGFEIPAREDETTTISITGTRRDILEVILRQMVLFGASEVRGEILADPKEHNATQRTIDVKRSTLSYHLTNLVKDGVLSETRHGRSVGYRIRKPIESALQMVLSNSMRVVM